MRLYKILLLILGMFSFVFANSYVCSTDPVYIDYKAGNRLDLNGSTQYASRSACEQWCRDVQPCITTETNNTLYYCPLREFENIGGNYDGGSKFTHDVINTCNENCYSQNGCVEINYNPCKVVDIEDSYPVTDYTGKTVYTKRTVTYECTHNETKQVGCSKWRIETVNGDLEYNITGEATIWKSRDSSDEARNTMAMLEQQLHIFSGWSGKCEHGWMFNNPFSDPMAILGYAMMVYNAAGEAAKGSAIREAHDSIQNSFDELGERAKNLSPFGQTANPENAKLLENAETLKALKNIDTSLMDEMTKLNTIATWDTGTAVFGTVKLLYTDLAQMAMSLVPNEEQVQQADYFNKAWMGASDVDDNALAYAQCMASIGLSFPNLASYSADDMNSTSPELKNIYDNPIRLTTDQIAILMAATSEKYVENSYYPTDYDSQNDIVTYIAIDSLAYTQAGQVICGGYLAPALNVANRLSDDGAGTGQGSTGSALANAGIKMVLGKMMPPYNIIASVIFDIITSLKKGDACHNTKTATQWGLIQLKTNQALNFEQCHHISTTCAAKWFWGKCMRHRENYCCYDQISTRIFAEGLKQELFPETDPQTGLPNSHIWDSCSISINDLKNISFRKCLEGEKPYEDHCFPSDKYDEFVEAMNRSGVVNFDFNSAAQQAINSLAIPNKICEGDEEQ